MTRSTIHAARAIAATVFLVTGGMLPRPALAQSDPAAVFEKESKLLTNLVERVGAASRKAAEIAPEADRWLLDEPLVLKPTDQPRRPLLPARPPKEKERRLEGLEITVTEDHPADEVRAWSLDLWNPEPLKTRWLAIRKQDEEGIAAKLALSPELKTHYEAAQRIRETLTTADKMQGMHDAATQVAKPLYYEQHHGHAEALAQWAASADAFATEINGFAADLDQALNDRLDALYMIRARTHQNTGRPPTEAKARMWVAPGSGLGRDTELARRHRYAMSDRAYISGQRVVHPTTWPICGQLFDAAEDFEFWYRWATDEKWYQGSDRRLDPVRFPKDDPQTKELHQEFASVVKMEHSVFQASWGREESTERNRWDRVEARPLDVQTRERWVERAEDNLYDFRPMMAMYFASRHPENRAIPPVAASAPGRLLPPRNK